MSEDAPSIKMIPISKINILNPRTRNKLGFDAIVSNISNIGLKRPITVCRKPEATDGTTFDLVCGQGRLEAYLALGQQEIPAIVIDANKQDCYLMSLVENLARRQRSPVELLREVNNLKGRGYTAVDIAQKIDMTKSYITGICHLLDHGEERLLAAVDKGKLPLSVAMLIANADEAGIQNALCEAYEDQSLRGRKLLTIRKLIEQRTAKGKSFAPGVRRRSGPPTAELLVRAYRQEADRQKLLIAKVRLTEHRLVFVVSAMKRLLGDENLVNLLRAEGLNSLPSILADKMKQQSKD